MTSFQASVTRTALGLAALNINDNVNFKVSSEILGTTVTWDRRSVSSPYVDGDVTVHRRRPNVQERFAVYCYGGDQVELQTNVKTLIDAFNQHVFNMTITLDSAEYTYQCESSDYQIEWSNAHMFAGQVRVVFTVVRRPIATVGV